MHTTTALLNNAARSCGCVKRKTPPNTVHGYSRQAWYVRYISLVKRCYVKTDARYHTYGARGIYVCERWLSNPESFYIDMGDCPEGMTLDRKDNDGPYSPENCIWSSNEVQAQNRTTTKLDKETVFKMRAMYCAGLRKIEVHRHLAPKNSHRKNTRRVLIGETWKNVPWPTEDEIQAILDGEEVDMQRFAA